MRSADENVTQPVRKNAIHFIWVETFLWTSLKQTHVKWYLEWMKEYQLFKNVK